MAWLALFVLAAIPAPLPSVAPNAAADHQIDATVGNPCTPSAETPVTIGDNFYSPQDFTLTNGVGAKVVWTYVQGNDQHTTTETLLRWRSPHLNPGDHYTVLFCQTGTFDYYCEVHGFIQMHGSVTIR
jgi:plastocyanin